MTKHIISLILTIFLSDNVLAAEQAFNIKELISSLPLNEWNVILGIVVSLSLIVGWLKGWVQASCIWVFSKIKNRICGGIPKKTLLVLPPNRSNACWWHMGGINKKPAMQIIADILVTNISKNPILMHSSKLRKPETSGHAMPLHSKKAVLKNDEPFGYYIKPDATITVRCDFWIQPPIKKEGEEFVSDVGVVDQYGNEHWLRKVKFTYT